MKPISITDTLSMALYQRQFLTFIVATQDVFQLITSNITYPFELVTRNFIELCRKSDEIRVVETCISYILVDEHLL